MVARPCSWSVDRDISQNGKGTTSYFDVSRAGVVKTLLEGNGRDCLRPSGVCPQVKGLGWKVMARGVVSAEWGWHGRCEGISCLGTPTVSTIMMVHVLVVHVYMRMKRLARLARLAKLAVVANVEARIACTCGGVTSLHVPNNLKSPRYSIGLELSLCETACRLMLVLTPLETNLHACASWPYEPTLKAYSAPNESDYTRSPRLFILM